jgi:hypothetical protein
MTRKELLLGECEIMHLHELGDFADEGSAAIGFKRQPQPEDIGSGQGLALHLKDHKFGALGIQDQSIVTR